MMGTRGAAAKVETKQVKKEIQERWKVLMWGLAMEKSLKILALVGIEFSEDTEKSLVTVFLMGPAHLSL